MSHCLAKTKKVLTTCKSAAGYHKHAVDRQCRVAAIAPLAPLKDVGGQLNAALVENATYNHPTHTKYETQAMCVGWKGWCHWRRPAHTLSPGVRSRGGDRGTRGCTTRDADAAEGTQQGPHAPALGHRARHLRIRATAKAQSCPGRMVP
jgi:hypothetical protein